MKETEGEERAELSALIRQAREGDEDAFRELLLRYKPLIQSVVAGFAATCEADREDLQQEAAVALYRAVRRFDTEQSEVEFGLYAKVCVTNALVSCMRQIRRQDMISIQEEAPPEQGTDPLQDVLEAERLTVLDGQIRQCLSHMEYRIWHLYVSGKTAKEIAERIGRDVKAVNNAIYRIRKKLRATIPENE